MTDKQIMIDGVNVAGCVRLQDDEISCDLGGECKGWENCYFKQLACKTQEYEQLQEKYEALKLENQEGYEIVAELKQECEELKEKFKKFFGIDNQECWDIAFLKDENARYRKALDEIEEHYEKVVKNLTTYDDSYDASISIEALHNISDIINKAKDGE